jgi:hypothetical protein
VSAKILASLIKGSMPTAATTTKQNVNPAVYLPVKTNLSFLFNYKNITKLILQVFFFEFVTDVALF